jgi:hypothetical protein
MNALAKVKKTCGAVNRISLTFRIIMGIRQRQTAFPVETRSVKIPNHDNTKIMCIQLVSQKAKVISNDFRCSVGVGGRVKVSNEQVKTVKSGDFNPYTFIARF